MAGNWSERLLKSLYYVTWKHGDQLLQETEALWQTVARNRRNVIPVLDFLLSCSLQEGASQSTTTQVGSGMCPHTSVTCTSRKRPL